MPLREPASGVGGVAERLACGRGRAAYADGIVGGQDHGAAEHIGEHLNPGVGPVPAAAHGEAAFGWRRTVTFFGCIGCAIATPLWYFASLASESFTVAIVLGCVYGVLLAGFVPLSALMPSMVRHEDKGSALAILNFGAGGAAFLGPTLVTLCYPLVGGGGVTIVFSCLYVAVAVLSTVLKDGSDPAEKRRAAAPV